MFKPSMVAGAAAGLTAMASAMPTAAQQAARPAPGPLTIEQQGSFFVGGRDVRSDTLSTLPAYAPSGTITVDQVYQPVDKIGCRAQGNKMLGRKASMRPNILCLP